MAELVPATLTPEEQAEFEQASAPPGLKPLDPVKDFDANELFELSTTGEAETRFDPLAWASEHKDRLADPATVAKLARTLNLIQQRGFELEDLPSAGQAVKSLAKIPVGLAKQGYNYLSTFIGTPIAGLVGAATGQGDEFQIALGDVAEQRLSESIAGTEAAVSGLTQMARQGAGKVARAVGILKPLKDRTEEEQIEAFWGALGTVETAKAISEGEGAFLSNVREGAKKIGEAVVGEELPDADYKVRPEEVEALAAGDPLSLVGMGGAFGAAGKTIGVAGKAAQKVLPAAAGRVTAAAVEKVGQAAGKTGDLLVEGTGQALRAAGATAQGAAKATRSISSAFPIVGAVVGTVKQGPVGTLAGIAGGEAARRASERLARYATSAGTKVGQVGRQLAGTVPMTGAYSQLAADVIRSAPTMVNELGKGALFDVGFVAATSETPAETEATMPFGVAFGAVKGVGRTAKNVVQGQYLAPRPWGATEAVPAFGSFPALDAMNTATEAAANPGQRQRVNAARQLGQRFGTEVYVAPTPEAAGQAVRQALLRGRDPASLPPAELAIIDQYAADAAQSRGLYTGDFPTEGGPNRRVAILTDVESAPHESFHGLQDVIGDAGNRVIDALVYQSYSPQEWRGFGQRYAALLLGRQLQPGESWMATILDRTSWGENAARQKIARDIETLLTQENPNVTRETIAEFVEQAQRERELSGTDWRQILTAEEAIQEANRYLAREIAAENFDLVAKNLGAYLTEKNELPNKLARVLANTILLLGGEPFEGARKSELGVAPKFEVAREVTRVGQEQTAPTGRPQPTVAPRPRSGPAPVTPEERTAAAADVDALAADLEARNPQQAEVLRRVSSAISSGSGLKVEYRSAPGEPGGSPNIPREQRREIIQAFRDMPEAVRPLFEKLIFPDRVDSTKNKGLQILGWSPENFAANAHRVARWLNQLGTRAPDVRNLIPYEIDVTTGSFTEAGWRALYEDARTYSRNQGAGGTGAGNVLNLPPDAAAQGVRVPPLREASLTSIPQANADFINLLFGIAPPETPRVSRGGRKPGNILAQDIVAANEPGRIVEPGRPRGMDRDTGQPKEFKGFPGRVIQEVNPLRAQLERLGESTGEAFPKLVEVNQRLNLEHLVDANLAPEAPPIRGVTDIIRAGFKPGENVQAKPVREFVDDIVKMDEAAFRAFTSAEEGGLTGAAYRLGERATPEELAALDVARDMMQESYKSALAAKDMNRAIIEASKGQFFREAKERATNTGSAIRKEESPATQFSPQRVEETEAVATKYAADAKIKYQPAKGYANVNEGLAKLIADFYEAAESRPNDPEVQASYRALADETKAQYRAMEEAGIQIEPWEGKSEPYKNSAEMAADVRDNKHLWFFQTENAFGAEGQKAPNALLEPSGVTINGKELLMNDLFRAVHDYFGHTKDGWQFGPRGEFNAWRSHSEMFSDAAQGALAAETLAQNSWVNYGKHLRDAEGKIPAKGEKGYVPPTERPFAEQKNLIVPREIIDEARQVATQFSPRTEKGKALEKEGFEFQTTGSLGNRSVIVKDVNTGQWVGEISSSSTTPKEAKIGEVLVSDSFRRRGLGEALYRELASQLEQDGVETVGGQIVATSPIALRERVFAESGSRYFMREKLGEPERQVSADEAYNDLLQTEVSAKPYSSIRAESSIRPGQQFSPKKAAGTKQEWKIRPGGTDGISKAWVLPDGSVQQLGPTWHHQWLASNGEKFGISKQAATSGEEARNAALAKGFARVNYSNNSGTLTVEARAKDWRKLKPVIEQLVEENLGRIDNMTVNLLDEKVRKVVDSDSEQLFRMSPKEKMENLPFITGSRPRAQFAPRGKITLKKEDVGQLPEEANFLNAWLSPDGLFYRVGDHREWAAARVELDPASIEPPPANRPSWAPRDTPAMLKEQAMKDAGWIRISREREGGIRQAVFLDGRQMSEKQKAALEVWEGLNSDVEVVDARGVRGQFSPARAAGAASPAEVRKAAAAWQEQGVKSPYFKRWFGKSKAVDANGEPLVLHHGTTFPNVEAFDMSRASVESDFGPGVYLTDVPFDAETNYSRRMGPDLRNRIEAEADRRANAPESGEKTLTDIAAEVEAEFYGGAEGTVMNIFAKVENPVEIVPASRKGTRWEFDEAGEGELGNVLGTLRNVLLESGLRDKDIASVIEVVENGTASTMSPAVKEIIAKTRPEYRNSVWDGDGLSAWELHNRLKEAALYDEGSRPGEVEAKLYQELGYDGVHLTGAEITYPGMGLPTGTEHWIVYDPKNLKSEQNRGTFDSSAKLQFAPKLPDAPVMNLWIDKEGKMRPAPRGHAAMLSELSKAGTYDSAFDAGFARVVRTGNSLYVDNLPMSGPVVENNWASLPRKQRAALEDFALENNLKIVINGKEPVDLDFTGVRSDDLPGRQFSPRQEETDLFGATKKFDREAVQNMTKEQLAEHFPEAIVPRSWDDKIAADIVGSPLYKRSGSEPEAVKAFADKLVEFADEWKDNPAYQDGLRWYSDFTPMLKKRFGKDAQLFAELLAATSPQTAAGVNFGYAVDAYTMLKAGRFDKKITKFNEAMEMIESGDWSKYYQREVKAGRVTNPPAKPSAATFLAHWIDKHDIKPKQSNGKLYGQHSIPVLQVFARIWLDQNRGPKTANFVENLIGASHEATIDLWADRTMRRVGYEGYKDRWRILPGNATGVADVDFAFSQKAFRAAADRLGVKPDALQGALWFAEKQLWNDRGWATLDFGDFRREMEKLPLLEAGVEQRYETSRRTAKAKPAKQEALELEIEPK